MLNHPPHGKRSDHRDPWRHPEPVAVFHETGEGQPQQKEGMPQQYQGATGELRLHAIEWQVSEEKLSYLRTRNGLHVACEHGIQANPSQIDGKGCNDDHAQRGVQPCRKIVVRRKRKSTHGSLRICATQDGVIADQVQCEEDIPA